MQTRARSAGLDYRESSRSKRDTVVEDGAQASADARGGWDEKQNDCEDGRTVFVETSGSVGEGCLSFCTSKSCNFAEPVRGSQLRREVDGAEEALLRRFGAPMPKTNSSRLGALAEQLAEWARCRRRASLNRHRSTVSRRATGGTCERR